MPKTRLCEKSRTKHNSLSDLLFCEMAKKKDRQKVNLCDMACTIGVSAPTLRATINNPGGTQLDRILRLAKELGISKQELFDSIEY